MRMSKIGNLVRMSANKSCRTLVRREGRSYIGHGKRSNLGVVSTCAGSSEA